MVTLTLSVLLPLCLHMKLTVFEGMNMTIWKQAPLFVHRADKIVIFRGRETVLTCLPLLRSVLVCLTDRQRDSETDCLSNSLPPPCICNCLSRRTNLSLLQFCTTCHSTIASISSSILHALAIARSTKGVGTDQTKSKTLCLGGWVYHIRVWGVNDKLQNLLAALVWQWSLLVNGPVWKVV